MTLGLRAFGQHNYLARKVTTTHYVGIIGKNLKIRMTLTDRTIMRSENGDSYAVGSVLKGTYIYLKRPKDIIQVSGEYNAQGIHGVEGLFDLDESVHGKDTGYFAVQFTRHGFAGTWHSPDDKHQYPFVLRKIDAKEIDHSAHRGRRHAGAGR